MIGFQTTFPPVPELFDIVHEDGDLLIINKPAGLVCHPTKDGEMSSLIGRVRLYLGSNAAAHMVNRLDRETSGIVIVAKSSEIAGRLGKTWESRAVTKEYLAIVHGHVSGDGGTIDAPLGKDERSRVAIKDCVRPDGMSAQTEFQVLRRFGRAEGTFSVLRLAPMTGRKHQIRIHLQSIGHPIVGDKLYGLDEDCYLALVEDRLTDQQHRLLILPFHALHAGFVRVKIGDCECEFRANPEKWFLEFAGAN